MVKKQSKTRLISDNRLVRMNLDVLIDSMKKGLFDSSYSGNIFNEKTIYSDTCKFKNCCGEIKYNQFQKYFYCSTCDRKQKLQFVREDKTLRNTDTIGNSVESLRKYYLKELEFLSQLLRNLYRIIVDNLELEKPTENQIEASNQASKKIHSILFDLRTTLSTNSGRFDQVFTIVTNNRLMTLDEIESKVKQSRYMQMLMIDRISEQFTKQNILKLTVLDIPDEPRKKNNLKKAQIKMKEILA